MILSGTGAFIAIAADVVMHGQIARADTPINAYLHQHPYAWAILLCSAISGLGELKFILPFALFVGAMLFFRKRRRELAIWPLALLGSAILNQSLKAAFAIPRPMHNTFYIFDAASGYSFPSGHTMAVTITAGTLALIIIRWARLPRAKARLLALAVVMLALAEAMALVYMGVHYLTDVLGALAVSLAWLGVIRWLLPPIIGTVK